jgi:hypothetical protein
LCKCLKALDFPMFGACDSRTKGDRVH